MMWLDANAELPRWRLDDAMPGRLATFSTRQGGVSEPPFDSLNLGRSSGDRLESVEANRARLLQALGLSTERLATAGQIHGAVVRHVDAPGHHPNCDGLVTAREDLAIAVSSADCLPILYLADRAVGAAHAGWRGLVAGIAQATLDELVVLASLRPEAVTIHFGPCIRACCFQVGPEVAQQFPTEVVHSRPNGLFVDLPAAARRALIAAGASGDAIHDTGACTMCEPAYYYSYRRDRGRTGRQWGLSALRSRA